MDKGLVANGNVLSRKIVVKNQVVETNYLERDIRGLVGFSPVDKCGLRDCMKSDL